MDTIAGDASEPKKRGIISEAQARQITGGRKPLMPAEWDQAIVAIKACTTFDEAKYWDNLAVAKEAWARIHHSDDLLREARAVRLYASRRLGEIGEILNPLRKQRRGNLLANVGGTGAAAYLKRNGMTRGSATAACHLAKLKPNDFERIVNLPRPPSPMAVGRRERTSSELVLTELAGFWTHLERNSPHEVASASVHRDLLALRKKVRAVIDWLEEFHDRLELKAKQQ